MVILWIYLLLGVIFTLIVDFYATRHKDDSIENMINRAIDKNDASFGWKLVSKVILYICLIVVMPFAVVVVAVEMMMGR